MENMKITNLFLNEETIIKNKIESMPIIGCINNLFNYLTSENVIGFEKDYVNSLNSNKSDLFKSIIYQNIADMNVDELKELIFEIYIEGFWGLNDRESYDQEDWLTEQHTDADLYEPIKKWMLDVLDELVIEKNKTQKEKEVSFLKAKLNSAQIAKERLKKDKENNEKEIVELTQKLAELEK